MNRNELKLNSKNIELTLKNDVLNRKKMLIQLVKLLNSLDENFVVSIDGNWGVGKTFFIKQLLYLYENENNREYIDENDIKYIDDFKAKYVPIYYNAWENDDHSDVIESFIYNILNVFPKYKIKLTIKEQDFEKIIKTFLKNLAEKITCGFISKETIDNIKSIEDLANNIITVEEQKESLYKIFDLLTKNNLRILLIVDELDRCKPDYAIKVLEIVKYGYNFNGYEYLNKIYDTILSLDIQNIENYISEYLYFFNNGYLSEEISYSIIKYLNFSLRECNSFSSMYKISLRYVNLTIGFDSKSYIIPFNIFLPLATSIENVIRFGKTSMKLVISNILLVVLIFVVLNILYEIFLLAVDNEISKVISKIMSELVFAVFLFFIMTNWLGGVNILENILEPLIFERIPKYIFSFKVDNQDQLEEKLIESYHDTFIRNKHSFNNYSIFEALTLMGNFIEYKRENNE